MSIPEEINLLIKNIVNEIAVSTQAPCYITIKEYSKTHSLRIDSDTTFPYHFFDWTPTVEIRERLGNILYMLEDLEGKYYSISLWCSHNYFPIDSEFSHIKIYDCDFSHKAMEGIRKCGDKTVESFADYYIRPINGALYHNGIIVGSVKPERLVFKL